MTKRPLLVLSLGACLCPTAITLLSSNLTDTGRERPAIDDRAPQSAATHAVPGLDHAAPRRELAWRPYELAEGERRTFATRWRTGVETRRCGTAPPQRRGVGR